MRELNEPTQALFTAIQQSDVKQVKQLLASDIDLEQKDVNGQTALTLASRISHPEILQLLISAGANLNPPLEPLVLNPRLHVAETPGGQNLGDLVAQATAEAPEEAKTFYSGFMAVMDTLSGAPTRSVSNETETETSSEEQLIEDADYSDDDDDDCDDDEALAVTPLGAAVLRGDAIAVKTLLQAGADPNPSTWYQTSVLVGAARKGHLEIAQKLIAAGANVNRGFDELPLHTAAGAGHLEMVQLLLDAGAEVEGYEEDRWTALMDASMAGHLPIVQLLVARGADVNAWSQGETPLIIAAGEVHRDVYDFLYPLVSDKIRAIGDRDAEKLMAQTLKYRSRKQNKAVEKLIDAAMDGKLKQVQQLIASGVDVNAIGSCNRTALSLAIQSGKISVIQTLLEAGADPNLPDETDDGLADSSPLMEAASTFFATNRGEMVRLLIQRGANVNQQENKGQTALMQALAYSDLDAIAALIEAGANLDIQDNDGNTALMTAELRENTTVANLLKQVGASQTGLNAVELLKAVGRSDIDSVRKLLQTDINVNARVGETTALCRASMKRHPEIIKLLVAAGADVNQRSHEGSFNPLLYAAYYGDLESVRILLEAGADVHVRVTDYLNPLEYAELGKQQGHSYSRGRPFDEVIALLERYGATRSA